MNVVSKTPASFLQELCIKRGITPTYQVIKNENESHMPVFIFEVTCNKYVTKGEGTSKKEAKHAAADKMLEILKNCPEFKISDNTNENPIPDNVLIPSPYEGKLKENAIGLLFDYCKEYELPSPDYVIIREEGPAHAKLFTERCYVHTFGVEATERTKKQAKQQVALQMITMLKNMIEPRVNREIKGSSFFSSHVEEDFQRALSKFPNVQIEFNPKFKPYELLHPIVTNNSKCQSYCESIKEIFDVSDKGIVENPEETLDAILVKADIKYSLIAVDSNDSLMYIIVLNINMPPEFPNLNVYELGGSYVEAAKKAAIKALRFMKILYSLSSENIR